MKHWASQPERGSAFWTRLGVWTARRCGWTTERLLLPAITAWFYVCSGPARLASRAYLGRVLGRPATASDVFRHMHSFAPVALDRVLLVCGRPGSFAIDVQGLEYLTAVIESGRGCLLLGGHLGSFEVLLHIAQKSPVPVKALMFRANAGPMTALLERLDPALAQNVIAIGDVHAMLRVHEAVAEGAIVGVLADRCPPGGRTVAAPFCGEPAAFPIGPFVLAASLGVPVLTFRGVRTGKRRYAIDFAPFADKVLLRRATRQADLAAYITRYAAWLEEGCRAYPFNWFNFFPFWEHAAHAPTQARPAVAAGTEPGDVDLGVVDSGAFVRPRAAAG